MVQPVEAKSYEATFKSIHRQLHLHWQENPILTPSCYFPSFHNDNESDCDADPRVSVFCHTFRLDVKTARTVSIIKSLF
jgi:hypothetical protein